MPRAIPRAMPVAMRTACIAVAVAISVRLSAVRSDTFVVSAARVLPVDRFARRRVAILASAESRLFPWNAR
jgi:hypothetical protein